ncbi:Na+:solute symporter [Thermoanaerobacteraceae bacterium SP2]|jgi:SSS family solute:Na+ symporter|nr:solute:Na+ symporter, family [Thermoanaerobacteraceae bacterium]RKL63533.1 Na+:solute symporter [Thermoanaerobacteraceae bacterium SP2]
MGFIDYSVLVLFFVAMIIIGLYVKNLIKGIEDYFTAGHRMPWWLAAISHHMSGYSAFAFIAYASVAYKIGFPIYTLWAVTIAIAMVLGALVFAPRWTNLGLYKKVVTPLEIMEPRFNNTVRQALAWSGISLKFIDEGLKLYSIGVFVSVMAGIPLQWSIIFSGIVALLYTTIGGIWADVLTDFAQFIVQLVITIPLAFIVLSKVGGWGGLWQQLPPGRLAAFGGDYTPLYVLIYLVVVILSYNGGTWGLAQRFISLQGPREGMKAAYLSAALYLVYPLFMFIPMWAAPIFIPSIDNPEHAYVLMANKFLAPVLPGAMGFMLAAMFAATMSMVDSDSNSVSAVFTKDIYQRVFDPNATPEKLLNVGRITTAVFCALSVIAGLLTPAMGGAFKAMMTWFAGLMGPVAIPMLFGLIFKRTTWKGALLSWLCGVVSFFIFKYPMHGSWNLITGGSLLITAIVFIAEGYISKMPPEKQAEVDEIFEILERN